jgi:glycosyltransferase involved in cell wall biosynthesis
MLVYNARLERHHLHPRALVASWLFWRGVPLDRIWLRPKGWPFRRERSTYPEEVIEIPGRAPSGRPKVAILSPYLPWPLAHGGAVRIYHLLREAARDFDVELYAFLEKPEADPGPLRELCTRLTLVGKPRYREPRWSSLRPPEVNEYDSPAMRRAWEACRADLKQVEYTQLASFRGDVLVEHDVTFDLYEQVARNAPALANRWNLWRWRRFERQALGRFRQAVVMSIKDKELLGLGFVLPNGVDLDRFRPEPEPVTPRLLFVGSFRHFPNLRAFRFLMDEVWPRLAAPPPLTVVAGPDPETYAGGSVACPPGVELRAFVADVVPLYASATLVVVPTQESAGTNVKVLEAMAMERAVISTPSGVGGLGLEHGESVWIAATPAEFAAGIERLLADHALRRSIARNARRIAEERFDWRTIGAEQKRLWESLLP